MMEESKKKQKTNLRQHQSLQYYLDVLTDGSELTGHGTVFLTISRRSPSTSVSRIHQDNITYNLQGSSSSSLENNIILGRYALTGLSNLTGRLAADQSFKLSSIRAVFCPLRDVGSISGIPSVLLALSNYSMTGNLNIVGPSGIEAYTHTVVDLILGRRRMYPRVMTCDVPKRSNVGENAKYFDSWWKVYEDEYIIVHARMHVDEDPSEKHCNGNLG